MKEGTDDPDGTTGHIERLYWREGELWIRMRTIQGRWLSLPWRATDLPRLTTDRHPSGLPLSPAVLRDLVRHLKHRRMPAKPTPNSA